MDKRITEKNFIRLLEMSDSEVLKSMAMDMDRWLEYQKTADSPKSFLVRFLSNNIADVYFRTSDGRRKRAILTSNPALYAKYAGHSSKSGKTGDTRYVMAMDVLENRPCSVSVFGCEVGRYIAIREDNVELIRDFMSSVLSRRKSGTDEYGKTRKTK